MSDCVEVFCTMNYIDIDKLITFYFVKNKLSGGLRFKCLTKKYNIINVYKIYELLLSMAEDDILFCAFQSV